METKQRSLVVNALIYGLILGAVFVVLSLIYYILDINVFSIGFTIISMIISLALAVVAILMATNSYRDKYLGGKITFGQCFLSGLIIGLVAFLISSAYSYIFMNYIEPDFLEEGKRYIIEKWGSSLSEEQLTDMIDKMDKRMTPARQIRSSLISGVVISAILGVIVALFIKKDKTFAEGV